MRTLKALRRVSVPERKQLRCLTQPQSSRSSDHLHAFSQTARPPSLIHHAQEAGRYTAIAIGHLDHDAARASEAIADAIGHLLTVSVFADAAVTANPAATHAQDE